MNRKQKKPKNVSTGVVVEKEIVQSDRQICDCEASVHVLIGNCLNCGRIVCQLEGNGPCTFCGLSLDKMNNGNRMINSHLLDKATDQKERLLRFDAAREQRQQIFDDQSDYYAIENNPFLSDEQRKAIRKRKEELVTKREEQKRHVQVDIDFMGRVVTSRSEERVDLLRDPVISAILGQATASITDESNRLPLPEMTPFMPMYVDTGTVHRPSLKPAVCPSLGPAGCPSSDHRRVQDDDRWFASVDQGLCLSISQPYASLLVAGIKRHEGRNWYTSHRGPLWIASTSRNVDVNVIEEMENVYRHLRGFNSRLDTGLEPCWDE